jgi:hypothetical protein
MANSVLALRENSIVVYNYQENGVIRRLFDLCEDATVPCQINEDNIFARRRLVAAEIIFEVNRRTGVFSLREYEDRVRDESWWAGQCRRTTDPRPPAAF